MKANSSIRSGAASTITSKTANMPHARKNCCGPGKNAGFRRDQTFTRVYNSSLKKGTSRKFAGCQRTYQPARPERQRHPTALPAGQPAKLPLCLPVAGSSSMISASHGPPCLFPARPTPRPWRSVPMAGCWQPRTGKGALLFILWREATKSRSAPARYSGPCFSPQPSFTRRCPGQRFSPAAAP